MTLQVIESALADDANAAISPSAANSVVANDSLRRLIRMRCSFQLAVIRRPLVSLIRNAEER